jgi:hypothetical protein
MPIEFKKDCAWFLDAVSVEEAEGLLEWLQENPSAKIDLSACSHLHAANLQILMAAKRMISGWPEDAKLRVWLEAALPYSPGKENQRAPPADRRKRQRAKERHHGNIPDATFDNATEKP